MKDKNKEDYDGLLASGMFWEFYPELSGEWEKDKESWKGLMTGKLVIMDVTKPEQ